VTLIEQRMKNVLAKTKENTLQKFTDSDSVEAILRTVYRLTPEHTSLLSPDKKEELGYYIRHQLRALEGDAYDAFYFKVKDILADRLKNVTWDRNHERIKRAIKQFVIDHQQFPTISQIAEMLQMSRVTVTNHLKELDLFDYGKEQKQVFALMFNDLIGQLFAKALKGDFSATKLLADIMLKSDANTKSVFRARNQQNFIVG
jgi:hypothetical protein